MEAYSIDVENQIVEVFNLQKTAANRLRNSSLQERVLKLKQLKSYLTNKFHYQF